MTGTGDRRPWWYSGGADGEPGSEPADLPELPAEPESDTEADSDPDTEADTEADTERDADAGEPGGFDSGMDWSLLVAGAQRMVDWATERVMAPHAEHDDPAQHPQCVVCRTLVIVGDSAGRADPGDEVDVDDGAGGPAPIAWIPIRDDGARAVSSDRVLDDGARAVSAD